MVDVFVTDIISEFCFGCQRMIRHENYAVDFFLQKFFFLFEIARIFPPAMALCLSLEIFHVVVISPLSQKHGGFFSDKLFVNNL